MDTAARRSVDTVTTPPLSSRVRIDVDAQSHAGHRRANNEDHHLVARLGRALQITMTSLPAGAVPLLTEEVNYVLIVADGMGGHAAGEVASRMALSALVALALDTPDWILRADEGYQERPWRDRARPARPGSGRRSSSTRAGATPTLRGMGTTLTAARSLGRDLLITHVGDSRAYLLRAGTLCRLTRDHTFAQLLVDTGQIAAADVATSGHAHVLTNALGGASADVQVDTDHVSAPRRGSPAPVQRRPDRSRRRRDDHLDPARHDGVARCVYPARAAGARQRRSRQRHGDRGGLRRPGRSAGTGRGPRCRRQRAAGISTGRPWGLQQWERCSRDRLEQCCWRVCFS